VSDDDLGGLDDDYASRTEAACARIGERAKALGLTVAVAESLTGGALVARLAAAPGSGEWLRGGVVAYDRAVKYEVLGVPRGPVVCEVAARAMAEGVARLLRADVALSLTGVAGPDEQDGMPVGTVYFGVRTPEGEVRVEHARFHGDPGEVVERALDHGFALLLRATAR